MIRSFFKAQARFPIFSVSDLDIMRTAIRNNARDNITGYLLRDDNTYLNVVEGPQDKVEAMLTRVARDSRAFGFQILSFNTIQERHYPGWSMGYHEHENGQAKNCAINKFLKAPEANAVEPVLAAMLSLGQRRIPKDLQSKQTQPSL